MASASIISSLVLTLAIATVLWAGTVKGDGVPMLDRFRAWQVTYNRTYASPAEFQRRFQVYSGNVQFIESTNRLSLSYVLGENQFTDLTNDEFRATYTMRPREVPNSSRGGFFNNAGQAPDSVDWRTQGAVTPIKNQQACGSCWAFAAVASIEGLHKIKTGQLVSLSEQEIVDCDRGGDDLGCAGGFPSSAMEWVARNGGLATDSAYPYEGKQGACRSGIAGGDRPAKVRGGEAVERNNEAALERAVAVQPVAVCINGSGRAFQFYKGGVFSGPCDTRIDHAVTAVGYGADAVTGLIKYWIVKNSWGETWGEKGYVRMQRRVVDKEGMCGIATLAHYPVM